MQTWGQDALDDMAGIVDRWAYDHYGLRVMSIYNDDVPAPVVGETLEPSAVWFDGEPTDEVLAGTCALGISLTYRADEAGLICDRSALRRRAAQAASYFGRYVVLIASNHEAGGQDIDEVILRDAVALAVYDRGQACCDRAAWKEAAS